MYEFVEMITICTVERKCRITSSLKYSFSNHYMYLIYVHRRTIKENEKLIKVQDQGLDKKRSERKSYDHFSKKSSRKCHIKYCVELRLLKTKNGLFILKRPTSLN